jgi:Nitronate monooxygenase
MSTHQTIACAVAFCETFNLRVPILMAPMAGASPVSLAVAIANAGGLGGCGALLMEPDAIRTWASEVRAGSNGGFQLNLWIPDPPPKRDAAAENAVRRLLSNWGPEVAREAGEVTRGPPRAKRPRSPSSSGSDRKTFRSAIAGGRNRRERRRCPAAEIVERTDGIPLFVEEMTKAV